MVRSCFRAMEIHFPLTLKISESPNFFWLFWISVLREVQIGDNHEGEGGLNLFAMIYKMCGRRLMV
jgi:hypothetical protein